MIVHLSGGRGIVIAAMNWRKLTGTAQHGRLEDGEGQ